MSPIISVANLSKTYGSGFKALDHINLEINRGEIFALLGPNGAGKTTLISIICGIANPSEGKVTVGGYDINADYRAARSLIGLVPQELHTDAFESVWATVSFSRGLFGKPKNPAHIEKVLKDLSLWDKKGKKELKLHLQNKITAIPPELAAYNLELSDDGGCVTYDYDTKGDRTGITSLLGDLRNAGIRISDLDTKQSSLEDIFVSLVRAP